MNPVNIALQAFQTQVWLRNVGTGVEVVLDRLQNIEASFDTNTERYYELARRGPIGHTSAPPEFSLSMLQNMTDNMEAEFLLAGLNPNPAGQQQYNLGQIVGQSNNLRLYALLRNADNTTLGEQEYSGLSLASIEYAWQVRSPMTIQYRFVGTAGRFYTAGSVIHTWGALDNTSLGGMDSKDAVIYFTSGSVIATDKAYRLQSFRITANFPTQNVNEIGLRSLVGTLADAPEVNVDFELLLADDQPTNRFYELSGGAYRYENPLVPFNAFVRVFDPRLAEHLSVLRLIRIENVVPVNHMPIRSQVRGLTTARYSLISAREAVTDSGGVTVSNRNSMT